MSLWLTHKLGKAVVGPVCEPPLWELFEVKIKEVMNMPGFDATGPRGMGSGTGWGRGPCGAGWGRGGSRTAGRGAWGRGSWPTGRGSAGARRRYGPQNSSPFEPAGSPAPGTSPDEVAALKRELETLQQRLAALEISQP